MIEVEGEEAPEGTVRLRSLMVDENYTHRYASNVNRRVAVSLREFEYPPKEARYIRKWKAIAQ